MKWHNGKLWIARAALGGILRVDPKTWVPEVLIRVSSEERPRLHDVCFDNEGNIWCVTGNNSTTFAEGRAGLNKYDGKTGQLLMTVEFAPGSCDPHGLDWHDGRLISCDAVFIRDGRAWKAHTAATSSASISPRPGDEKSHWPASGGMRSSRPGRRGTGWTAPALPLWGSGSSRPRR